jgi:hypothetical protein
VTLWFPKRNDVATLRDGRHIARTESFQRSFYSFPAVHAQ